MNAVEKYNWNKTRQKGRFRFILRETLFLGLLWTFLYIVFDYLSEFFIYDAPTYLHTKQNFVFKILLWLAGFSIAGFITGYYSWNKNEDQYLQHLGE